MAEPSAAAPLLEGGDKFALPWETGALSPQSEQSVAESLFEDLDPEVVEDFLEDTPGSTDKPASDRKSGEEDLDDPDDDPGDEEDEFEDDEFEDEDEDDAEESEEEEDEDDRTQELADDTVVDGVPLPGGETTAVTLAELKAGYSRTQDYTRKRQRDAAEHAEAMTGVRGVREQYDARLGKLEEVLQSLSPPKPDAELRRSNPGEYAAQMAEYTDFQEQLSNIGTAREGISDEREAELIEWRNDRIVETREKLVEAIPEWSDPNVAKTKLKELGGFLAESWGFTEAELDSVVDHRLVLMALENMEHRGTTERSRKRIKQKRRSRGKRVLKPGATETRRGGKPKRSRKERERAERRLSETGHVRDAARLIELDLPDDI